MRGEGGEEGREGGGEGKKCVGVTGYGVWMWSLETSCLSINYYVSQPIL